MATSWWFVGLFAASGAVCFAATLHGSRLRNQDAKQGLRWLLVIVGTWALLQAGVLLATQEQTAITLFTLSLVVGFATPFAWLYFVSAYAGLEYHRRPAYRIVGLLGFLVVTVEKLTNPIHGRYFSATLQREPVRLLVVDHGPLYVATFVLAYALTGVGFYFLYRLYRESEQSSLPLAALFAATGLAVVPNLLARTTSATLPQLSYEPLGVAVFAVGVVYVVDDTFRAVERTATRSFVERTAGAVLVIDSDGRVRDRNDRAEELFPSLAAGETHIEAVSLAVAEAYRAAEPSIVAVDPGGGSERSYYVAGESLEIGGESFGWAVLVQDVTDREDRRERIERHEEQLSDMAGAIAHELRNGVAVADGYLAQTIDRIESGDEQGAAESAAVARRRIEQIGTVIEDLHTLVYHARDTDESAFVSLTDAVRGAERATDVDVDVHVEGAGRVVAVPTRLEQLFKNALAFAAFNEAETLTVTVTDDGFAVADDGRFTAADGGSLLFEYESAEPRADAGMSLPNVRALARVEGWHVALDHGYEEGVRYVVRDATMESPAAFDESPSAASPDA